MSTWKKLFKKSMLPFCDIPSGLLTYPTKKFFLNTPFIYLYSFYSVVPCWHGWTELFMFDCSFQQSWQEENDRMREKLLGLIGKIGRDARIPKTTGSVSLSLVFYSMHYPRYTRSFYDPLSAQYITWHCSGSSVCVCRCCSCSGTWLICLCL